MTKIELHKIVSDRRVDSYSDSDEDVNNTIQSTPVTINIAAIRCYNPRRDERPGTRITFTDGGGFAVTESYDEVGELLG